MNAELLKRKIAGAGMAANDVCRALGLSRSAYYRKLNGKSEFTLGEIQKLIDLLDLDAPMDIFFARKVS